MNSLSNTILTPMRFLRLLFCAPFFMMVALILVEASLQAAVTYLVIEAGKDIARSSFKLFDFVWIVIAQGSSYALHGISWVYGERAGFTAYSRYMSGFARDNRFQTGLMVDKSTRERVEPFLTNETFHLLFEMMYELEGALQLFFGLLFSAIVIGFEIDAGFPAAYAIIFVMVMLLQYCVRKPVSAAYLNNQKMTNRLTAQTYTAWDNIFSGNRYNFSLWLNAFKAKLRLALHAQIRAIVWRESLSTVSGVIGLAVIFSVMAWVVQKDAANIALLAGLAATLPKQIDMTHDVHNLALGWNDLLALWTRSQGVVDNMQPQPTSELEPRLGFDRLQLRQGATQVTCENLKDAMAIVMMQPTGRINVRGQNGAGKSSLLLALRKMLKGQAYYWPTADRLAFEFSKVDDAARIDSLDSDEDDDENDGNDGNDGNDDRGSGKPRGYSSGEQQLAALREIVTKTNSRIYLLDEWDANLDGENRAKAQALINTLAQRARVVEISHRD
jgi:ABC-type multidrug transport system fused ATPase/permease subunit